MLFVPNGCNSAPAAGAETPCDPLATHPTTLGTILGAGRDPSGTVYVADRGGVPTQPSVVRVFVAADGSLVRQDVIGSGGMGTSEVLETFRSPDGSTAALDLVISLDGDMATSMTLGPEGSARSKLVGIDAGAATPLVLVDPKTVQDLPATDLPGIAIYVADSSEGHAIVVTSPLENDLGSAAFHLFYGPPNGMRERPIVSFDQALSGFPTIAFTVNSQTLVLSIGTLPPAEGGLFNSPGPVTLTGGGQTVPFVLRPAPTTLDGFTFTCLKP